jgi:hypothetical protein
MAELVAKTGLVKQPGFLYFLRDNEIWRSPLRRAGEPATAAAERVWAGRFAPDPAYLYFIGPTGDVLRAARATPSPSPLPNAADERDRPVARFPLPLSPARRRLLAERVGLPLRELLELSPAQVRLQLRGRWSQLHSADVRALAGMIADGEPTHLWIGKHEQGAWIEFETAAGASFLLARPLDRDQVRAALATAGAPKDESMIEFYATFGELGDFVLPSPRLTLATELGGFVDGWRDAAAHRDAPIVYRAPNGDRALLARGGEFRWANHETCRFQPAAASFAELLRRYLCAQHEGRAFDAFVG